MQWAETLPACCRVLLAADAYYAHKGLLGLLYCLICHLLASQAVCSAFEAPSRPPCASLHPLLRTASVRRPDCQSHPLKLLA